MGGSLVLLLLLQTVSSGALERFQMGLTLRAEGNHAEARKGFSEAWDMGYRDAYVLYSLIEADRAVGDKPAGMRHFRLFAAEFPDSPWLHVLYADAYMAKDQQDEARREYEEALHLNPRMPGIPFRAGYIDFRNGDFSKAEALFRREIEMTPKYSDAHLFLAESLRQLGRTDEAIPYYRQAIALDPKAGLAYRALVAALTGKGDLAGAADVLEKAEAVFPEDPSFPAQLARLLARLHRDEEALRQQARFKALMEKQRQREVRP